MALTVGGNTKESAIGRHVGRKNGMPEGGIDDLIGCYSRPRRSRDWTNPKIKLDKITGTLFLLPFSADGLWLGYRFSRDGDSHFCQPSWLPLPQQGPPALAPALMRARKPTTMLPTWPLRAPALVQSDKQQRRLTASRE